MVFLSIVIFRRWRDHRLGCVSLPIRCDARGARFRSQIKAPFGGVDSKAGAFVFDGVALYVLHAR
jgi:hypothetical protein